MSKNILDEAAGIVYKRSEEKSRQYGDFHECMDRAARIASEMQGKKITTEDVYAAIIGIKLARQAHKHKYDNLLDGIAYLASMNDYIEKKKGKK